MFSQIPSEISLDWIYFPPLLLAAVLGWFCAYGVTRLLNITRLNRFFWNPPLAFLAFWVLMTSMIGLIALPL